MFLSVPNERSCGDYYFENKLNYTFVSISCIYNFLLYIEI